MLPFPSVVCHVNTGYLGVSGCFKLLLSYRDGYLEPLTQPYQIINYAWFLVIAKVFEGHHFNKLKS